MAETTMNRWSKTTSLGLGRFTYDRTYKVWSFEVKDMNFKQFNDLENFLMSKETNQGLTGTREKDKEDDKSKPKEENKPKADDKLPTKVGRQQPRSFTDAEIRCAKKFIDDDRLGTWRSLADYLCTQGFPRRATEVVFTKFRDYAEIQRDKHYALAHAKRKDTDDNSDPRGNPPKCVCRHCNKLADMHTFGVIQWDGKHACPSNTTNDEAPCKCPEPNAKRQRKEDDKAAETAKAMQD